jgi:acetylornithine aminotransferase
MRLNPVLDQLGTYAIAEVRERARALRAAGKQVVDFSIGDPREPTPGFVPEALRAAVPEVSQYPTTAGLSELRRAVAGYVKRRFGVTVDADSQVIPTSGAKEAIFNSALAFVTPGAGELVAYPTPGYPVYEWGARFSGAVAHPVRLGPDFVFRAGDLSVTDWERTRLIWSCSPHNPAGSVTDRNELDRLVETVREHDALFMSDECYADIYEGDPPPSALQAAAPDYTDVLVYLSLSKRSGMTGYRSGAIVGDPAAIGALKRFRSATGTASPDFVQAAAVAAWSDDAHVAERREVFARKRAILRKPFETAGHRVAASTAGLYLWIEVGDDLAVTARLLDAGVVVSPGRAFGPGGEGYIRLALVPAIDECEHAAEVVATCLQTGN